MKHITNRLGTAFGVLALATLISAPAFALGVSSRVGAETSDSTTSTSTTSTGRADTGDSTTAHTEAETHLAGTKLTLCSNHKDVIEAIMSRIADRGQKQLDLFTTIATKVENVYTSSGKTVSNYNTLVADINAKHTAAQTTVTTIKTDSTKFSCTATNPQGIVTSFKTDLKAEISALQAYRTSVRNLTVAVKTAVGTSSTTKTTGGNQ